MLNKFKKNSFRIRTVELNNGNKKFYPEFRQSGITSSWETVVKVNDKGYITLNNYMEDSDTISLDSNEQAIVNIEGYKNQLIKEDELKRKNETFILIN